MGPRQWAACTPAARTCLSTEPAGSAMSSAERALAEETAWNRAGSVPASRRVTRPST